MRYRAEKPLNRGPQPTRYHTQMPFVSTLVANPETYAETVTRLAKGETIPQVAAATDVSARTVSRFVAAHRPEIGELRDRLKRQAIEAAGEADEKTGGERFVAMVTSLLRTAAHGEERARAPCARAYAEIVGLVGQSPMAQQGNITVNIDKALLALDGSVAGEEMRRALGA